MERWHESVNEYDAACRQKHTQPTSLERFPVPPDWQPTYPQNVTCKNPIFVEPMSMVLPIFLVNQCWRIRIGRTALFAVK
ncbi:MAG: hypothetical protein Q4D62_07465 [Planctomycetia bacterium]|nr:hypothetical protein [Planctomycetia bacterium]